MKILLIGCGKMGSAMLGGWLESGISNDNVLIVDPISGYGGVRSVKTTAEAQGFDPDYIIISVKPQTIDDAFVEDISKFNTATLISNAAGTKISTFKYEKALRAMPNLPALIGRGVTGLFSNWDISDSEKSQIERLFTPLGEYIWVDSEELIDSVTAISGSGPAYIFLILDAMISSAKRLGLSEEQAKKLAFETMIGSVETAKNSDLDLVTLKQNVTSKGGTTAAALNIFEEDDALRNLIDKAIDAAKQRSVELSQ